MDPEEEATHISGSSMNTEKASPEGNCIGPFNLYKF